MKIVVFGATGNIGTSLLEELRADESVTEIVGVARRLPDVQYAKTTFRSLDMAADELDAVVQGADAVVHAAWLFQPSHDPMVTWRVNAVGTRRLLDAVARGAVPTFVYVSSVGAYSPNPGVVVDESWPTDSVPTAAYGREKAYVERALDSFELRSPQTRVVRLRPAFVFKGPASSEQRRLFAGPFLPGFLFKPGRLPVLPLPSNLRFQAVHSRDVGRALHRAITTDVRGPFNLAGEPVINAELLGSLFEARTIDVRHAAARFALAAAWHAHVVPVEPALLDLFLQLPLLDTTRARRELGWIPRVTSLDALREFVEGIETGAGGTTPPLEPDSMAGRGHEIAAGGGERDT